MAEKYYISDLHLGHKNVIEFDQRPFASVEEMDRTIIGNWKNRVGKDDDVYILGDFSYRSDKGAVWYLKQLPGRKHLIIGNHDGVTLKNPQAMSYFEDVVPMMHIEDRGRQLCLCHFPICEWNGYHRGSIHIYGHIHNRLSDTCLVMRDRKHAFNAAACINNYTPSTLDEIIVNNRKFEAEHPLSWADLIPMSAQGEIT